MKERESSWSDCLDCDSALRVTPDKLRAKSLMIISRSRIAYLDSLEVNEKSANFLFEDYYNSVTELIHALVLINGFKVINHVCLGFYLRDITKNQRLFEEFDYLRIKRNSIVYYGKTMDYEIAKDAVNKSKQLIKELTKIIPKET